MKNVRTIIIFALILSICFIVGCEKEEQNYYIPEEDELLMFKIISDKRVFNIEEDVLLTVAYGWIGYREGNDNLIYTETIPMEYRIYNVVKDENNKERELNSLIIKTIDDLFTLKYKITPEYDDEGYYKKLTFSYYEDIIIPKTYFEENSGEICFLIFGEIPSESFGAFDRILYRKEDNQIIIEEPLYKFDIQHGIKYEIKQA